LPYPHPFQLVGEDKQRHSSLREGMMELDIGNRQFTVLRKSPCIVVRCGNPQWSA
jgi:hypothetical protein